MGRPPSAGESLGEVLNFLLQLGFREVGAPFAAAALRAAERGIATDLAQLGLLLPFRRAAACAAPGTQPARQALQLVRRREPAQSASLVDLARVSWHAVQVMCATSALLSTVQCTAS